MAFPFTADAMPDPQAAGLPVDRADNYQATGDDSPAACSRAPSLFVSPALAGRGPEASADTAPTNLELAILTALLLAVVLFLDWLTVVYA